MTIDEIRNVFRDLSLNPASLVAAEHDAAI
jgi:hypothetical protein